MKKIMTLAMAVAAITFASCGGSTGASNATDSIATDTVCVETDAAAKAEALTNKVVESVKSGDVEAIKTTLTEAKEEVERLIADGDIEGAQAYASQVKALYEENKQKIEEIAAGSTTLTELFTTVTSIPTEVTDATSAAGEAIKADAEAAKEKAAETVDAAKEKAAETVEAAKEKAAEAAANKTEEAKQKAKDAAAKAIDDAASKLLKR